MNETKTKQHARIQHLSIAFLYNSEKLDNKDTLLAL